MSVQKKQISEAKDPHRIPLNAKLLFKRKENIRKGNKREKRDVRKGKEL